jgi:hypothetical protein
VNHLSGPIPSELGLLNTLRFLLLKYNNRTGLILKALGSLVNLTDFSVESNDVTGAFPTEFCQNKPITKIVEVDCFEIAKFCDCIPR